MSESILPDDANLYRFVQHTPYVGPTLEEVLASRAGGDPVEWIPEVEAIRRKTDEIVRAGGSILLVEGKPVSEGLFAGYYEVRLFDYRGNTEEGVCRILYASEDQVRSKQMIPPDEGLFMLDTPPRTPMGQ